MSKTNSFLRLRPRYYRMFTDDPEEMRESNYAYRELDWKVPLSQAALVCLDVWNRPKYFAADTLDRTEHIVKSAIVPLLEVCRGQGLQVIHAPADPVASRHPNLVRPGNKEPCLLARRWPPREFISREGKYAVYAPPVEPIAALQKRERETKRDFHPDVRPVGGEAVVLDGDGLHEHCEAKGILHLFYVGFWVNFCMVRRSYGVLDMKARGYNTVLVRDCTTGMETHETQLETICTRGTIATLEQMGVCTVTSEQMTEGLAHLFHEICGRGLAQ